MQDKFSYTDCYSVKSCGQQRLLPPFEAQSISFCVRYGLSCPLLPFVSSTMGDTFEWLATIEDPAKV